MKPLIVICALIAQLLPGIVRGDTPYAVKVPATGEVVHCTAYPPQLAPGAKAGLVIHLYGHGGSNIVFNAGRPPFDVIRRRITERGYWLIVPDLGPRHWMSDDAVDRLDAVIKEWTQKEDIDPARVHLLGSSMGASSSLLYVMRRPGKIRSVAAIFPVTDQVRFFTDAPNYRESVGPAHHVTDANREAVLRAISPLYHAEAFQQTPVFLVHGAKDTVVNVAHSREFAAALQKQGSPVIYRESPEEGHHDEIVVSFQEEIADFLTKADANSGPARAGWSR
ncbi:MAG: prolyl oligopeptidase family serine peptidase [Verrucomicrobia bacterium]|nr:prolyl oligopeptidase family serine peptidase [Verrucomicrobiota bacterium]